MYLPSSCKQTPAHNNTSVKRFIIAVFETATFLKHHYYHIYYHIIITTKQVRLFAIPTHRNVLVVRIDHHVCSLIAFEIRSLERMVRNDSTLNSPDRQTATAAALRVLRSANCRRQSKKRAVAFAVCEHNSSLRRHVNSRRILSSLACKITESRINNTNMLTLQHKLTISEPSAKNKIGRIGHYVLA